MPLMTGFVRDVRALVDRPGEGKGRPLTLAIRVGRDVAECESCGLDVRTWAAEGLADLLIPMWAGRMDTEADVAGMVALARTADSAGTRVAGGLVGSEYGYGTLPVACDHNAWRPHGLLYTLYASRRMRGLPFGYEREDDADAAEGAVQYPPDLLRLGRNELTITVRKRREDAGPLLITGIEALINYDGGE